MLSNCCAEKIFLSRLRLRRPTRLRRQRHNFDFCTIDGKAPLPWSEIMLRRTGWVETWERQSGDWRSQDCFPETSLLGSLPNLIGRLKLALLTPCESRRFFSWNYPA